MKNFSIFLFLALGAKGLFADANATLTAAEFFVDTDPGEGSGTALQAADGAFDSEVESIVPKDLNVTGLAVGPHLIGVRFKDNNNTWGEVLFQTIHVYDPNPSGGGGGGGSGGFATIKAAEYFVDVDPGEGSGVAFQPKDGAFDSEVESVLPKDLNVTGLAIGPHLVGVRYQDDNNTWGEVLYQTIHVYDANPSGGGGGGGGGSSGFATVKAAEYFVDVDPGEGSGVAFQAQDGAFDSEVESVLPKDLNVTGLAVGAHLVGVRYQDDNNTWGEVLYQTIHVYDANPSGGGGGGGGGSSGFATIKAAEYFVDTDPGEGNGVAFQPQDGAFDSEVESVLPMDLNVTGLAIGPHLVGVRYQENNNTWGEVLYQTIHVYDANPAGGGGGGGSGAGGFSIITAAEYFIGTDPGEGNATALQPKDGAFDSEVESTLPTSLSMAGYPIGAYLVGVRYKDNNNTWGEVLFQTVEVDVDTDGDGLADKAEIYYETNASIPDTDGDGYLDGEEVAFGSDPTDPNSLGNRAPTGLDFSGLGILENAPVGTVAGDFNSTDTDANSTLRFAFADGNGSTHNNLFSIDANGSLVTAAPLDYETNATLYVRVEALDEHNYSFVRQFVLNVIDVPEDLDQDGIADHLDPDIDGDGFSNAEEIAYGSDPLNPNSVANQPPSSIGLDNSNLSENLVAGTVVGKLNATDPDPGTVFSFAIAGGEQWGGNQYFQVDEQDNLVTTQALDHETTPTLQVRIRVSDQHGSSIEEIFAITIDNDPGDDPANPNPPDDGNTSNPNPYPPGASGYVPSVRTESVGEQASGQRQLAGMILTDGGSAILETGFIVSRNISFQPSARLPATLATGIGFSVSVQAAQLEPGKLHYFRAYAINAAGESLGSIKKFRTHEQSDAWWAQMPELQAGWRHSVWFGTFRPHDSGWIYHAKLGWAYALTDGKQGLWLWTSEEGWLWTQPGVFPHLWKHHSGNWLYLMGATGGKPVFHDYATGSVR